MPQKSETTLCANSPPKETTSYACVDGAINARFFETGGLKGQSCEDALLLDEFFGNGKKVDAVAARCGPRKLQTQFPGCQEDTYACPQSRGVQTQGSDSFEKDVAFTDGFVQDFHLHAHNTGKLRVQRPNGATINANTAGDFFSCNNFHGSGTKWTRR
eukprot:scaffold3430_cov162-Amphora_coffeaeformis.AAC.4